MLADICETLPVVETLPPVANERSCSTLSPTLGIANSLMFAVLTSVRASYCSCNVHFLDD